MNQLKQKIKQLEQKMNSDAAHLNLQHHSLEELMSRPIYVYATILSSVGIGYLLGRKKSSKQALGKVVSGSINILGLLKTLRLLSS